MRTKIDRLRFLQETAAGVATALAGPFILPSRARGADGSVPPSARINLGFIGVGGMGRGHLRSFLSFEDVMVRAVCDVRSEHRNEGKAMVDGHYGNGDCSVHGDFRELLAREDIDAVVIATPDHWHVLVGVEAARRGKAMYYEKPMSRTVAEAQAMREAVRRHGTIFQFGSQQRSDARFRMAVEWVRNGRIGGLKRIIIGSASYEAVPTQPVESVPPDLDYEMWLGPAPWAPYCTLRCTRQWTLISDYSIGCLGGAWGIHHVDIAQWALDADASGPVAVEGQGTVPAEGLFDTFQTFEVEHTYANGVKLLHLDHRTARRRFSQFDVETSMGILFEGSGGWIYVARGFIDAHPKSILRSIVGPNEIKLPASADHRRNFIDAVRSGTDPICPVGPGVKSEIVCQQAEIALRIGQKLEWDNEREQFINHAVANRMLSRPMRAPWRL